MARWRTSAASLTLVGLLVGGAPTTDSEVVAEVYTWAQVPIGAGGFVTGIVGERRSDGHADIYARTDIGGAFRWNEDTGRWRQLLHADAYLGTEPRPEDFGVASIAVAPGESDAVYLAVGDDSDPAEPDAELQRGGRVLRSLDGGETWSTTEQRWFISANQRFRQGTERLAVDPDDPRRIVFGTQREGLWRSFDGGESWAQVPLDTLPAGLAADPLIEQAGVNFAIFTEGGDRSVLFAGVAHDGIYRSDDGGDTWQLVLGLDEGDVPAGPAVAGEALLVAVNTPDDAAARLVRIDITTSAVSEVPVPYATPAWNVAVDPTDAERLVLAEHAVRDGHLWTSSDGGLTWFPHEIEIQSPEIPWLERTDLDDFMTTGRLMFDPVVPGRVWFAEGMGVWRAESLDAQSVTWQSAALGIEETVVSGLTVLPDGTAIATVADRQGFRLSSDGYPSAPLVDERFASGSSLDFGGQPNLVAWVGAESNRGFSPDRVPRGAVSTDGGVTWQEMGGLNRDMFGGEVAVSATDPSTIVWMPSAIESPGWLTENPVGVYVSNDGGRSWTRTSIDGRDDTFHRYFWWFTRRALAADRVNGNFYALSDEARVYVSADGGHTWTVAPWAPPCQAAAGCHVFGQLQAMPNEAGHLWASVGEYGLHHSADAGQTLWEPVTAVTEAQAFTFGAPVLPGGSPALYVWGRVNEDPQFGLWRSDNLGADWTLIARHPFGLANQVHALAADPTTPGRVYVGFRGSGVVVGDLAAG